MVSRLKRDRQRRRPLASLLRIRPELQRLSGHDPAFHVIESTLAAKTVKLVEDRGIASRPRQRLAGPRIETSRVDKLLLNRHSMKYDPAKSALHLQHGSIAALASVSTLREADFDRDRREQIVYRAATPC